MASTEQARRRCWVSCLSARDFCLRVNKHCAFLFDGSERAGNEVRSYAKRTDNEKENACGERVVIEIGTYMY